MTINKEDITDKFLYSLYLKVFNIENHSCKVKQSHLRVDRKEEEKHVGKTPIG